MSAIAACIAGLQADTEEVDLSAFGLFEELDDATWDKLQLKLRGSETLKRVQLPPLLIVISLQTNAGSIRT
jgi:hypothetical protein